MSTAHAPDDAALAEAVEVYRRTYTTVLRSTGETRLRVLEASHKAMHSSLHAFADSPELDLGAFLYAVRRLPDAVFAAELVVMGQSGGDLRAAGLRLRGAARDRRSRAAAAVVRRRQGHAGGADRVGVRRRRPRPHLVAFQIEWNKLHAAGGSRAGRRGQAEDYAAAFGGRGDDWAQLQEVWGGVRGAPGARPAHRLSLRIRMLGGTQVGYARVTRRWWQQVTGLMRSEGLLDRPAYFVSSDSHSLGNLVTGLARRHQDELIASVDDHGPDELRDELRAFREGRAEGNWDNLLYYAARMWLRGALTDAQRAAVRREEREAGVIAVGSRTALDVSAQVIALDRLDPNALDERLGPVHGEALRSSRAVIVNVDYPLGLAAYNILREVAETAAELRGVYVLGKAATLNADVGDVMISGVIHDEHSGSTFWLDNAFRVSDIAPYLRFGSGLDNQRAVTVKGTFLQNRGYLDFYHREAFSVVEMEAGPYCCAMYEMSEAARYPMGEPVNFSRLPVDFGVIHYASDTPYTQARTLGARGLSYFGMDSTYASSVAILRRILRLEGALVDDSAPLDAPVVEDGDEMPAEVPA